MLRKFYDRWPPPDDDLRRMDLGELREQLGAEDSRWTDDDLRRLNELYVTSQSCSSAALGHFELAAVVCSFRPHLTEVFLAEPLGALLAIGYSSAIDVISFVRYHFDRKQWVGFGLAQRLYGSWYPWQSYFPNTDIGPEGRNWLINVLPQQSARIGRVLKEVLERHRAILEDEDEDDS